MRARADISSSVAACGIRRRLGRGHRQLGVAAEQRTYARRLMRVCLDHSSSSSQQWRLRVWRAETDRRRWVASRQRMVHPGRARAVPALRLWLALSRGWAAARKMHALATQQRVVQNGVRALVRLRAVVAHVARVRRTRGRHHMLPDLTRARAHAAPAARDLGCRE